MKKNTRFPLLPCGVLSLGLLGGLAWFAHGAEFVNEPFTGTVSTTLAGTGSGSGWLAEGTGSTWTGAAVIYESGLSFVAMGNESIGTVVQSGNAVTLKGGSDDPLRKLASTYTVGNGEGEHPVLYLSFLYANTGTVPAGHEFRVALYNGATQTVSFGKDINASWRIQGSTGFTNVTSSYIGNFFAVVKLEYNGTDTVATGYLAKDSDAGLDLTDLSTYARTGQSTITGKAVFDTVRMFSHNTTSAKIDEIRIGDDLANVTATADPLLSVTSPVQLTTHNAPETVFFTVNNLGETEDLVITSLTPGGADAARFTSVTSLPLVIPAGSLGYIDLAFTPAPTYQASYTTALEIVSNDSESPATVTLNVTNHSDPRIQAADIAFSNNGAAASYSIPFSNIGLSQDLSISGITVGGMDGETTVSNLTYPSSLSAGGMDFINFTFTPDLGSGAYAITFTVNSNDLSAPEKVVAVTLNVADPTIGVSPAVGSFGILSHDPEPQEIAITLSNSGGTLPLVIADTTTITGSGAFTIVSPARPFNIPPGGSTDLVVSFDPGTASGRISSTLEVHSNAVNQAISSVPLTAFVKPAGTVVANFGFDPGLLTGVNLDEDVSGQAAWTTGILTDMATGLGASNVSNQTNGTNRLLGAGTNGNRLGLSSNRESDAQTPLAAGGDNESTWMTFVVTPQPGGSIQFTGGTAVADTYAFSSLSGTTSADWTLYYSVDGGTTWTSLGTSAGATISGVANSAPVGVSWDLSSIGSRSGAVHFIIDPVSTGGVNGTVGQRRVGLDNLMIAAASVTPGSGSTGYAAWAIANDIPGELADDDHDEDGLDNLLEYALGLSPTEPDAAPGTFGSNQISFTKGSEAVANGDVSYTIKTSIDLAEWLPVDADTDDDTTISYTLPAGQTKIFARLEVTQVAP